jgi:hypothetical protein
MPQLPKTSDLYFYYPRNQDAAHVARQIGGSVQAHFENPKMTSYKDTCAIRVSRALNYAGAPIPYGGGGISNPFMADKKIRTDKGSDGKWYIYSTYDMRAYLTAKYRHPRRFPGSASKADLKDVMGIVAFAFYHIDVWNGKSCAGHDGGFENEKVVTKEILVWTTPLPDPLATELEWYR